MRLIDADALREKLNGIGGCGAKDDAWAAGWDKAIDTALLLLDGTETADAEETADTMTKDEYHAYLHDQIESIDMRIERFSGAGTGAMTAIAILICERDRLVDKVFEFECEST